jgi:RND family efflux transporter MFP subunit
MNLAKIPLLLFAAAVQAQQPVDVVAVVSKNVERKVRLPGEFAPYLKADLFARVNGFVEKVEVDRGSVVKQGQLLAVLSAPELTAQRAEAEAKAHAVESQRAEAQARLVAAESTYERVKAASATPGAVAGNEVIQAEKAKDAAGELVRAQESSVTAAKAAIAALRELEGYLRLTAPFDGVITDRFMHPGALAGPSAGPLLRLEQNTRLRLVVAVPEAEAAGIVKGARVAFRVPAFPAETFRGSLARVAHSVDAKTRTMAVELDVANPDLHLAPGMYPEVEWPVRRSRPSMLVPASSVVATTERTFVIRVSNGRAEWVNVSRGATLGDLVEVFGPLNPGDQIVRRGSDEIREGAGLQVRLAAK